MELLNSAIMMTEKQIESFKLLDDSNSNNSESGESMNYVRMPRRKVKTKRKSRLDNPPKNRTKQFWSFFAWVKILAILILIIVFGLLGLLVFNLYEKIDHLSLQLQNMESSSKKFPEEFHSIHLKLQNLEETNRLMKENITHVSEDIIILNRQVKNLMSTTDSLRKSIAAAPQIEALPKKVISLQQSVATMGSKLTTLETTVKEIRERSGNENKQYLGSMQDIQLQIITLQNKSKALDENFDQLQFICNNNSKFSQSTLEAFQEEIKQLVSVVYDNSSFNSCTMCNNSAQIRTTELVENLTKLYHALLLKFEEFQNDEEKNLNKNLVNMNVIKTLEESINQSFIKLKEGNSLQLQSLQNDIQSLNQKILHIEEQNNNRTLDHTEHHQSANYVEDPLDNNTTTQ